MLSSYVRAVRTVIDDGKVPLTLLFARLRRTRCGIADKYDGNVPVIALFSRPRYLNQHTHTHTHTHTTRDVDQVPALTEHLPVKQMQRLNRCLNARFTHVRPVKDQGPYPGYGLPTFLI